MGKEPLIDMHTHTVFSDGTTTPEENVTEAKRRGLAGLAITDHDTGEGIARAMALADDTFMVVPGTEFSAELAGLSVHVLAYYPNFAYLPLVDELARLRHERFDRARRIVEKFNALGVAITFAAVEANANGAPIGRPHIAKAVVDIKAAKDLGDVFDRFLADDGPCYVPKYALHPVAAVALIGASGGVAVLAHPGLYGANGLTRADVAAMVEAGLMGIEATHPAHSRAQAATYREFTRFFGVSAVAGSDFHGTAKTVALGDGSTPRSVVDKLQSLANQ